MRPVKVVCEHCGLPFSVARAVPGKPAYCCSGCALAARVSGEGGGAEMGLASVSGPLAVALGAGFLFFNQALFWMLGVLLQRRADLASAANAERLALASFAAGALAWLTLTLLQVRAGAGRGVERLVAVVIAVGLVWTWSEGRSGAALALNALFTAWSLRGLARKKLPEKNDGEAGRRG